MLPYIASNDLVITRKTHHIKVDDVVVMHLPDYGSVIKRVSALSQNAITLMGDNVRLTSSCCGIPQDKQYFEGKVILKLRFSRLYWPSQKTV